MDRASALNALAQDRHTVPAGQPFVAAHFDPLDGPGLARLFFAVYGDAYPIDTYYIPAQLIEEHRRGNLHSVVARTPSGDVVSHCALYRSSAPNPHLFEYGLGLTLPDYRSTTAFFRVNQLLLQLVGHDGIDAIFGETVCNHVTTQKLATTHVKGLACAVEPVLMPAEAYDVEKSAEGRVGCLTFFRVANDSRRVLYLPSAYRGQLTFILDGLTLDRDLQVSQAVMPRSAGELEVAYYDFAAVARCRVRVPGADLDGRLAELEHSLQQRACALVQFFVDLGEPWSGDLVQLLRKKGYCFGGLLPVWFGSDALLMQKHFVDPDFQGMKILSERGRAILEMARSDWESRAEEGS